ncbi:hypothetical protein [Paenimyroides baculatum]|uniref:Uncharacterized protein n=1 Tax=Paenimyroides baculatum TaxID=2608000 RepID=A0A5M6CSB6_9FLAO|nr:hypothetical protein [Paenimyroides baculatum]KAA5537893.1 hypothetical protein F0460_04315 [Paenimyroides baculatum]
MYIFQTEFYKYSPAYFDEISILENEVLNNSYLIKTKELLKDTNYYGQLVLGFYRNNWYPLILPLNVKDEKELIKFVEIVGKYYQSKALVISDIFKHLSIEDELERLDNEQTIQLNIFLETFKKIS